jgi:hypothetical protein
MVMVAVSLRAEEEKVEIILQIIMVENLLVEQIQYPHLMRN